VKIQVVSCGGETTRAHFEHGECSGQQAEGNIKKPYQIHPNFDMAQKNKFMHDAQRALEEE
jgi:hypothetical protein